MRRYLPLLALFVAISGIARAEQAKAIPIVNPGFEAFVLNCPPSTIDTGGCWNAENPGWQPQWFNLGSGGTFRPGPNQFPGGVPGGVNCGYVGTVLGGTGGIFQALNATLEADTTYILRVSIGHRADEVFTGYAVSLLAGGVELASDNSLNPAPGTFVEDTITVSTGPTPPLAGQVLAISIKSVGDQGQVDIDNVSLIAVTR